MTSNERLVAALENRKPDRLPVTTHHLMPFFLKKYMSGMSNMEFFDRFALDAIHWTDPAIPPSDAEIANWRVTHEEIPDPQYPTVRYVITTPKGALTTVLQSNEHTTWRTENVVKGKRDIDLIAEFLPVTRCDVAEVARQADELGARGIVRGMLPCFPIFGQPGCWQDAACLYGIQELIMAAYDDPVWVHELLGILRDKKLAFARSLHGARYDVLELGGGDASSTVISPALFEEFVAPYDAPLIAAAHEAGQRIAYHTCGGMMPILELIVAMGPDAIETLTPPGMGGDARLGEAKERVGDKVCLIGGWDQFHFFQGCTEDETRAEVRRCFAEAGKGGGFILCPSDHFFDAEPKLIAAWADEARRCVYD